MDVLVGEICCWRMRRAVHSKQITKKKKRIAVLSFSFLFVLAQLCVSVPLANKARVKVVNGGLRL
jgi:hypothetical protein